MDAKAPFLPRGPLTALLLAVGMLAASPGWSQRIDDGLAAHYPFEGNLDESAGIDTAPTVRGTLEYPASGAIGRSLRVSGDDEIDFTGLPGSTFAGDFTLAFFMNIGSTGDFYLFGKEATCDSTSDFFTSLVQGSKLIFQFANNTTGASVAAAAPRGRWAHVALVRGGSQATVYVDGVAAGTRALPVLNLGSITAPFGLGTSPCIGRQLGNPTRPVGGFDELRVYASALSADKIAAIARRPSLTATPRAATAGGRTVVRASHLVLDRTYELRLSGPASVSLFKGQATAVDMSWTLAIPAGTPVGTYKLQLVSSLLRGKETIDRTTAFVVAPPLTVAATAPLQAGKRATFNVGNLSKDGATSVRLSYAGRVIAGPTLVESATHAFTLVLPTDHPAGLPASVAIRAEQVYGRVVSHVGNTTLAVAAPFVGRFATTTQVTSSLATARPTQTTSVTGRLALADGATPANTALTAYWIGDNGDVTPLPLKSLAVDAQGNFRIDALPPSLGNMSAVKPESGGKIRLVSKRVNALGRTEWVTEDGPRFETIYDTDPDTDITVRVHRTGPNGTAPALEGAYVVLSSTAPLGYTFDPPSQGSGSGEPVSGSSLYQQRQPLGSRLSVAQKSGRKLGGLTGVAVNQMAPAGLPDLPPPPAPACGTDLFRRFTDAQGRAEFPVLGGPEEEAGTYQRLVSLQTIAKECDALGCQGAEILQTFDFFLSVYTLHKGAGFVSEVNNGEVPTTFRIRYIRNNETFEIKNLRTGQETVQQVSANLYVEVPPVASGHVALSPPLMSHWIGGTAVGLVSKQGSHGFGRWLDFSGTHVSEFANASPEKRITFGHRPDVNGSLTSAALYLYNRNGHANKIVDFQQTSFVDGCNLQDEVGENRAEHWRASIPAVFDNAWRFPEGKFYNAGDEQKACGYIEVANAVRVGIRQPICFYWQDPPAWVSRDSGFITVDDSNMTDVVIEQSGHQLGQAQTRGDMPNQFFGEPLEEPGDVENSSNARESQYANIGPDGPIDTIGAFVGNNPKQFSQDAAGAKDLLDTPNVEAVVSFGEDEFQTILDTTIPLFQWYWGVPEILSAEVYARLRVLASYYFHGTLTTQVNGDGDVEESLDMLTDALFGVFIAIGVDVDVLFGAIIDAGASLNGIVLAETPVKVTDGVSEGVQPCLNFKLVFYAFVDPCTVCPTPVIEIGGDPDGVIIDARTPNNCTLYSTQDKQLAKHGLANDLTGLAGTTIKSLKADALEMRAARRHPALDFDNGGNGMLLSRNEAGQIVAQGFDGFTLSMESQLTAAMGARDPQIVYFDEDRALAVWSESALPEMQFREISSIPQLVPAQRVRLYAKEQRLAWATWDGDSWSPKSLLTAEGRGEGQISLTACHDGDPGCPAGGEAVAVWQRNANFNDGDASNDATTLYRLWHARFTPANGFAAPALIASPTSNVQDITPSVTYVNGRPLVVWARQFAGNLEDFRQRVMAYRVLPDGVATEVPAAPAVIAPSVVAAGTSSVRVAWLRADPSTSLNPKTATAGAVGTNNALYVTQASCTTTSCSFPQALVPATRDENGRRLYGGERPRLIKGQNDVVLTMRVFRLENPDDRADQTQAIGDPIGTIMNTGDLMLVAPNFTTGIARVTPITADGFMHSSPAVAYNPIARTFVAGSALRPPPFSAPFRAALKASGHKAHLAYGKAIAANGNLQLTAIVEAPDLLVEALETSSTLAPGASQTSKVVIANRGTGYSIANDGPVTLELRWNSPGGYVLSSYTLPDIEAGGAAELDIAWTAPADAFADEAHVLHAVLRKPDGFTEITDANNAREEAFAGLPVPQTLGSSTVPGIPHVQLGWEPQEDARVAGYRVYRQEPDGTWAPLGASPVHGFLDISATFNRARTYAVSSYSARGVESALSNAVTVMPTTTQGPLPDLLRDGFEGSPP